MMRSDYEYGKRRWFNRPDMLMAAASGALASALLLLLVPSIGTLFLEILAGLVMAGRAFLVRRRERMAAQLRLALQIASNRLRLPDRYEIVLVIILTLGYGATVSMIRGMKAPEIFIRVVPLLLFAAGLLMKNQILHAITRSTNLFRERWGRPDTRTAREMRGEN